MFRTRSILPLALVLLTTLTGCDTPVQTEPQTEATARVVNDPFSAPILVSLRDGEVPPPFGAPRGDGPGMSVATSTVPGVSVSLLYPTPGQPASGACWMGLRVAGNGDVYPSNGHIWRVSPTGVLLNAFEYNNLIAMNTGRWWFELDEPNAKMYVAYAGLRVAPFVQGATFTTLIGGLSTNAGAPVLGRGALQGSVFVNEANRIARVTLSPASVSTFASITTGGNPEGLASAPDGTLYAARALSTSTTLTSHLLRISPSGVVTLFATSPGTYRRMVAVDENGNVYWGGNGSIDMYAPSGTLIGSLPGPPNKAQYGGAFGSAFDSQGNLYVMDNWGCREIYKFTFSGNQPPVATLNPVFGVEGAALTFAASVADPDGDALTYTWSFGDGGTSNSPPPVSHTYANNLPFLPSATPPRYDAYQVSLTVADDHGNVTTVHTTATIANVAPTVSAGPDVSVMLGEPYDLTAVYSDPGAEPGGWEYNIDWGDGTSTGTTTAPAPGVGITASRQYGRAGCYRVRMTVREKLEVTDGGFDDVDVCVIQPVAVALRDGEGVATVRMNPNGNANVAVLLAGTADFDAASVRVSSVTLGDGHGIDTPVAVKNNGTAHAAFGDVDGDGDVDLTAHFSVPTMIANGDLTASTSTLCLNGRLADGTPFRGCAAVRVLP